MSIDALCNGILKAAGTAIDEYLEAHKIREPSEEIHKAIVTTLLSMAAEASEYLDDVQRDKLPTLLYGMLNDIDPGLVMAAINKG